MVCSLWLVVEADKVAMKRVQSGRPTRPPGCACGAEACAAVCVRVAPCGGGWASECTKRCVCCLEERNNSERRVFDGEDGCGTVLDETGGSFWLLTIAPPRDGNARGRGKHVLAGD